MGTAFRAMPAIYNSDGRLSEDQLDCFTEAFRMFDTDGSGAISTLEFRDVCLAVGMTPTDDELKAMINELDTDGSGALSHSEMREVLMHLGEKMDDDEITDLIQTVDIDGDGEVDLKEFLAVVLDRAFVI